MHCNTTIVVIVIIVAGLPHLNCQAGGLYRSACLSCGTSQQEQNTMDGRQSDPSAVGLGETSSIVSSLSLMHTGGRAPAGHVRNRAELLCTIMHKTNHQVDKRIASSGGEQVALVRAN